MNADRYREILGLQVTTRSAVGVSAVLNGDDFDPDAGLDDLVDDPVVTSAGTVFALELKA